MCYCDSDADRVARYVAGNFVNLLRKLVEEERFDELSEFLPDNQELNQNRWTKEKIKIVLQVLGSRVPHELQEVLSYLHHSQFGWGIRKYNLYNKCIGYEHHCRENYSIESDFEVTQERLSAISEIFLNKHYGAITTVLFGYALMGVFSSVLKRENLRVPYFLQIACGRESNVYKLIYMILEICDINYPVGKACPLITKGHASCRYDVSTVYPNESAINSLEALAKIHDLPVIVDGYDNEKYYTSLLRETANILGYGNKIKLKDKFNILPIFICPQIKASYRHILNLNLTNISIDEEYLKLIEAHRYALSCFTYELVMDYQNIFMQKYPESKINSIESTKFRILLDRISMNTTRLRTKYRSYTQLNIDDVTNISYINFFFSSIIDILKQKVRITDEMDLINQPDLGKASPNILLDRAVEYVTHSLFDFFTYYSSPFASASRIEVTAADDVSKRTIKKKGINLARDMAKYYRSYGVGIEILPEAEYKDGRYAFAARLIPGTDTKEISRYSDEVRRLLGIEFLIPIITSSSIQFITSDKPLKEYGLLKILESDQFKESKMDIPYAIGYDMMGDMVIADIDRFPHLVIGGASGSGKSSAIHNLFVSIVCKQPSDKVKLLLMDFGGSRLNIFQDTPHMLLPGKTISDVSEGKKYIEKLREEVERRIRILDSVDARHYDNVLQKWPSIICIIDEFPTFIRKQKNAKDEEKLEDILTGLLERARKIKVHFVLAAQDATQGNIKIKNTNLSAGIAFRCENWHISKAIIGEPDAEKLNGVGSLYLKCYLHDGIKRLQGAYMEPSDIMNMLDTMKFSSSNRYSDVDFSLDSGPINNTDGTDSSTSNAEAEDELLLLEIVRLAIKENTISNNMIKKRFGMGYNKANKFLDQLEQKRIIYRLRPGTKVSREVNLQIAEAYIKEHEYAKDLSKSNLPAPSISQYEPNRISSAIKTEKAAENELVSSRVLGNSNADGRNPFKKIPDSGILSSSCGLGKARNKKIKKVMKPLPPRLYTSEQISMRDSNPNVLRPTSAAHNEDHSNEKLVAAIICMLKIPDPEMYRPWQYLDYYLRTSLKIDHISAVSLLEKMSQMNILSKLNKEGEYKMVATSFDELPDDVKELLLNYGQTEENLRTLSKHRKT